MTTLHFGVNDIPYSQSLPPRAQRTARWRSGRKPWQSLPGTTTTGDVAEILEKRYRIFGHFHEIHGKEIAAALEEVVQVKLENLLMGGPVTTDGPLFAEGDLTKIAERFRKFLDDEGLNGIAPGVPTQAALKGINHRLAHPYRKSNPPRPSFIDTGLYQANARVWVTE